MRRAATLTVLLALAVGAAGCGGGEEAAPLPETVEGTVPAATTSEEPTTSLEGDAAAGKNVYAKGGCGGCHTMEAANSSGTIGPNLDDSQPDFALAVDRVTNGRGAMPSFEGQLTEQEIADVSQFVVESTG